MNNQDKTFIDNLLKSEEITEEDLQYIDSRWDDLDFRKYYNQRLKKHYQDKPVSIMIKYLPLIILTLLIIIGIILLK